MNNYRIAYTKLSLDGSGRTRGYGSLYIKAESEFEAKLEAQFSRPDIKINGVYLVQRNVSR